MITKNKHPTNFKQPSIRNVNIHSKISKRCPNNPPQTKQIIIKIIIPSDTIYYLIKLNKYSNAWDKFSNII